ncbi:MAG TPA: hypothetical protein VIY47_04725, partial [Ignavibacteriaceae bacterium]
RSNRVFNGIMAALNHPQLSPDFNIRVKASFEDFGVPAILDFAPAIKEQHTKEAALRMVENHFRARGVAVNMRVFATKRRAEYIRMLTYGFALKGDTKNSYQGLELLKKYAKMGQRDAWVVQHTYDSVTKFVAAMIQQKPKKKPQDQVKDIQF